MKVVQQRLALRAAELDATLTVEPWEDRTAAGYVRFVMDLGSRRHQADLARHLEDWGMLSGFQYRKYKMPIDLSVN